MLEKTVEHTLVEAVRSAGGLCPKFVSPGLSGVPDRIILLPHGRIAFAEVKAPGKHMRPLQELRARQIRQLGFPVYVIDSIEQIGGVLDEISAP